MNGWRRTRSSRVILAVLLTGNVLVLLLSAVAVLGSTGVADRPAGVPAAATANESPGKPAAQPNRAVSPGRRSAAALSSPTPDQDTRAVTPLLVCCAALLVLGAVLVAGARSLSKARRVLT